MKFRHLLLLLSLVFFFGCHSKKQTTTSNEQAVGYPTPFYSVNPFIGTDAHGHTYPGATSPFGMVQLSPDTRLEGWDGCGGYHYSDSIIYGFSHTHLQGTGVPDYCDILFMPTNSKIKTADKWNDAYKSKFRHETEEAHPGYYKVKLDDYDINAELATTTRTGIHKYEFAKGDSCRLFIDMMHRDDLLWYDIGTIGDTVVYGYRVSKGWADEQHCYFYAVFSKPFKDFTQLDVTYSETDSTGTRKQVYEQVQVFSLRFDPTDELMIKVGISGTDVSGAEKNLRSEAPHWNFNEYRELAKKSWSDCLAKARIVETDTEELTKYYTALYHCYTVPNTWSDVDGRYRGMDKKIHVAKDYTRYTVFSLWDTFRAYHPLMCELEPQKTRDWIRTYLDIYKERNELPVWELAANETYCMIGYHSIPVIVDAYMRGIRDFDHRLALEAMVASATGPQQEKIVYDSLGYVPSDMFSESVSKTLEFAYDDWCIAQFAKALGEEKIYERFIIRAQNWKNVFDPVTKFMRPRRNGGFPEPFDPYQVDFNYTEANAWQYSFFVLHDIETLVEFHGGQEQFSQDVRELFNADNKTTGREQSDITGLIGQYAHGNEPSHHASLLFNYGTACYKPECYDTYSKVKSILKNQYSSKPDGLCGNEDCGQMSAWYVLAKNGLYPILPGNPEFITFNPSVPVKNVYAIGNHEVRASEKVMSKITDHLVVPIPIIMGPQTSFRDSAEIKIYCADPNATITLNVKENYLNTLNNLPDVRSWTKTFTGEFSFFAHSNLQVSSSAQRENFIQSKTIQSSFYMNRNNMQLTHVTPYSSQYTGGGENALIDGIRGGQDFRTGTWQGWQGQNVTATIDLGSSKEIKSVTVSCLEEIKSWIWFPSEVEIFVSNDGKNFLPTGKIKSLEMQNDYAPKVKEFSTAIGSTGRYIQLIVKPAFATIPEWHLGAGDKPWIFIDEIIIE